MRCRTVALSFLLVLLVATTALSGSLDELLDPIDPDVKKWATVVVVGDDHGRPTFTFSRS